MQTLKYDEKTIENALYKFNELYPAVFAEDDTVKNCGREATSRLILLAGMIEPNTDFGDTETGFMNIHSIRMLHKDLQDKACCS